MSGRHQPEAGADSFDDSGKADHECDYCGKTIYRGLLRQVQGPAHSISWLCEWCYARQQQRYEAMA